MENNRRILIADDDPSMRSMLELMLGQDFSVDIATNGSEATNYLDTNKYDVVILDIHMPEVSGLTLLEQFLKEEQEGMPHVIVISADDSLEQILKAYALGAAYYIQKPFNVDAFGNVIQRFLSDLTSQQKEQRHSDNLALQCARAVLDISLICQSIESEETLARQVTRALGEVGLHCIIRMQDELPNKCFDSTHGLCTDMEPAIFDTMERCPLPLHMSGRSFFKLDGIALLVKTMPDNSDPHFTPVCEMMEHLLWILAEAHRGILRRKVTRKAIAILTQIDHKIEQADQHLTDAQSGKTDQLTIADIGKEIRTLHNQLSRSIDRIKEDVKKATPPTTNRPHDHTIRPH